MRFATEAELVAKAAQSMPFRDWMAGNGTGQLSLWREVPGLFGIPVLLAIAVRNTTRTGSRLECVAFEMKLCDWRRGLVQAFRYRSFASQSYLVLDLERCKSALSHLERFTKADIGLVGVGIDGTTTVFHRPHDESPYSEHLTSLLEEMVLNHDCLLAQDNG